MRVDKLIAATHGRDAARAYRSYVLQPHQRDRAGEIGQDVLRYFARVAGACTGLSAVYATALRGIASLPAYVVAGSLSADGARVFGNDKPVDGKRDFADSNLSWDGHVWVMIGDYVADISIGWTARFGGPSALTTTVAREFGPTAGLLIVKWRDAPLSGLVYSPQYVLSDEQVATLDSSALAAFEKA